MLTDQERQMIYCILKHNRNCFNIKNKYKMSTENNHNVPPIPAPSDITQNVVISNSLFKSLPIFGSSTINLSENNNNLFSLKKKGFQQKSFIQYNLDEFIGYSIVNATERLRQLDYFHMHSPQEDECILLNIPNDRINLHVKKNLLFLCGGGIGVRFSGDDLKYLDTITKELSESWVTIENTFKCLDSSMKKILLKESDLIEIDFDSIIMEVNSKITNNSSGEKTQIDDVENKQKFVLFFHRKCNDYLLKIKELQQFVKCKQETLTSRGDNNKDSIKIESDPEINIGHKIPQWISILMDKYMNSLAVDPDNNNNNIKKKITIGKLSVFLSSCVCGEVECNPLELESIQILLQASNDQYNCLSNSDVKNNSIPILNQKYWANRIYNFMSKVIELKTTPRDEKALDIFNS